MVRQPRDSRHSLATSPNCCTGQLYIVDPSRAAWQLADRFRARRSSSQTPLQLNRRVSWQHHRRSGRKHHHFLRRQRADRLLKPDALVITPPGLGVTNYGVQIAAIPARSRHRDLVLDITSSGHQRGGRAESLAFTSGKLDYAGPATGAGSLNLSSAPWSVNSSGLPVSLATAGLEERLRFPSRST